LSVIEISGARPAVAGDLVVALEAVDGDPLGPRMLRLNGTRFSRVEAHTRRVGRVRLDRELVGPRWSSPLTSDLVGAGLAVHLVRAVASCSTRSVSLPLPPAIVSPPVSPMMRSLPVAAADRVVAGAAAQDVSPVLP
jgi:hypothetical protein